MSEEPSYGRTAIRVPLKNTLWIVNDSNGLPVKIDKPFTYLAWHKSTGRFYIAPDEPRQYLGKDLPLAIMRFNEVAKKKLNQTGLVGFDVVWSNDEAIRDRLGHDVASVELKTQEQLDTIYRQKHRDLILTNPQQAAREFGIPELANLATLPRPEPSMPLTELLTAYQTQPNAPTKEWLATVETYWLEFGKQTEAKTVGEINADNMRAYLDTTVANGKAIQNRFGAIKSVLSNAMKIGKDQANIKRALDLTRMLEAPKKDDRAEPQPINPKDFKKLVAASDVTFKAIFLLSLNASLHRSEVAAVQKTEIDLKRKTLNMERGKTG